MALLENLAVRQEVLRHVTDAVANQPLTLGPATAGQIALVDQAWREIASRYGALDAGQYAELVGASPTSRSVASKARAKGLVVAEVAHDLTEDTLPGLVDAGARLTPGAMKPKTDAST